MSKHAALLQRIEQQFGVPGAVVISIWGLETDFGAGMGKHPVVRAVATLAHDCRRTEMFQRELMSALTIINRGDMSNAQLLGAWAGEIGQTQFLPSSYVKFAVDFDGNGRRDLIRSVPDALASTANYLRGYGWQRGGRARGRHAEFRGAEANGTGRRSTRRPSRCSRNGCSRSSSASGGREWPAPFGALADRGRSGEGASRRFRSGPLTPTYLAAISPLPQAESHATAVPAAS